MIIDYVPSRDYLTLQSETGYLWADGWSNVVATLENGRDILCLESKEIVDALIARYGPDPASDEPFERIRVWRGGPEAVR